MNFNAAERRDVSEARKAAKLWDQQRREIIVGIMSVGPGRAWMYDLLSTCHIFSTSYSSQMSAMAFAEGERNIGLRLLNDIMSACPDEYITMMREYNERNSAADNRNVAGGRGADANGRDRQSSGEAGGNDVDYDYNPFRDEAGADDHQD